MWISKHFPIKNKQTPRKTKVRGRNKMCCFVTVQTTRSCFISNIKSPSHCQHVEIRHLHLHMRAHTNCFWFITLLGVHSSHQDYFTWFDSFSVAHLPSPITRLFTSLGKSPSHRLYSQKLQPDNTTRSPCPHNASSFSSGKGAQQFSMLLPC